MGDRRQPAVLSTGPSTLTLTRCEVAAWAGPAALYAEGSSSLLARSCSFRGGATVEISGKCQIESSWLEGFSALRSRTAAASRLWNSRFWGDGLRLGGPAEIVGCDVQHLELEDGAQVDASLSKLRDVAPTGKAWLSTDRAAGEATFPSTDALIVEFKVPRVDDAYEVALTLRDRPAGDEVPWLGRRFREGFEIRFLTPQSVRVGWVVSSL